MRLEDIRPKSGARRKRQRVGRGISAGQGATCGFGMRGQKARSGRPTRPGFEGGQLPLYRRIPKLKHFQIVNQKVFTILNVSRLAELPTGTVVTMECLMDIGLITSNDGPLKILGNGELNVALTVKAAAFSQSAKTKIEAAGGRVEISSESSIVKTRRESIVVDFRHELETFLNYPENWDSYESHPPNQDAIFNSIRVLEITRKVRIKPDSVLPSAEGGIGISFWNEGKYADLECFNTGEIIAVKYDRGEQHNVPETWYIDPDKDQEIIDALRSIQEFMYSSVKSQEKIFRH